MLRLIGVRDADRGAIAMIVAMLFGFGVMIGLAALTIDVGNINANRRQLQNGADAVALAAVKVCAETGVCPDATNAALQKLENANANPNAASGVTGIRRVDGGTPICGSGGGLPPCPLLSAPNTGKLQECPAPTPALPTGTKYLRAYTQTTDAVGTHLLPYSFGAAIAGVGSGANQQTCAAVAWGTLSKATVFPFAFSACEWTWATTGQAVYPPPSRPWYPPGPPYDAANRPRPSWQKAIVLNDTSAIDHCANWQGHDLPGGFGWVDTPNCNVTLAVDDWIGIDQGMGKGNNCDTEITQSLHKIINIPVYDCVDDSRKRIIPSCMGESVNPSSAFYHIKGFASFYMTGIDVTKINIPPDFPPSTIKDPTPSEACAGKCIYGWFLRDLILVGEDLGGTEDFGTTFMKLIG